MDNPWRKDFPIFQHDKLVYLDSAATAQKPQAVIDAISQYYSEECGTVHRAVYPLSIEATEKYSAVREKVCQMIGAQDENEVIFTKGTTEGMNLLASTLGRALEKGDDIIISEMEHHANIIPWQEICRVTGARLKVIPVNDQGELALDQYHTLLSKKTKIVSVTHVSNVTGVINPVDKVTEYAHEVGAIVVVDGAQAVSHLQVDVNALDVDFYLFSGHKIYGPTGIGVLYGKKEHLENMPPYQSGGDMVEKVTFEETTFQSAPLKFEAGTPNIAGVIGLGSALDYLNSIDHSLLNKLEHSLFSHAMKTLDSVPGIQFFGPMQKSAPIISFRVDGVHPLDIGTLLGVKGISIRTGHLCAQPLIRRFGYDSVCRVSFGLYNTFQDVDLFVKGLLEALEILKGPV